MRAALWFVFGCLLGALPVLAFADDYEARITWRTITTTFDTKQLACDDKVSATQQQYTTAQLRGDVVSTGSTVYSWICKVIREDAGDYVMSTTQINPLGFCDSGGTLSSQNGTFMCLGAPPCPTGQTRNPQTGQCSVSCQSGDVLSQGYYQLGTSPSMGLSFPGYGCINGCGAVFDGDSPGARQVVNSKYVYFAKGSFIGSGETCQGGPSIPPAAGALPPMSCASGDAPGVVNGASICVNKGTGSTTNPHTPVQQSDTVVTDNGDGTTTTTKTNSDGSKTVTVTGPGGSTTTVTPAPGPSYGQIGGSGDSASSGDSSGAIGNPGYGNNGTGDLQDPSIDKTLCDKFPNASACKEKVPIDEDGVPAVTPSDFLQAQKQQVDDDANAVESWFTNRDWEVTTLPFVWNPPVPGGGACSNWTLYNRVIDICDPLALARDIWGWVFSVLCAVAIWIRGTNLNNGA